jgi:MerR family transcriptional regulator, redox-sensitive transcriptional activator SoxR
VVGCRDDDARYGSGDLEGTSPTLTVVHATDLLTIGELADRSGVAPSGLRFYESKGLISATRTAGNQRRYPRTALRRIAFLRSAQRVGLTLEEISEALSSLPDHRTPTRADWARLSESWRPRIEAQIDRLERLRDRLDSCIGCGCLSIDRCALSNPDDVLAAQGPGAVHLQPDPSRR